MKSQSASQERGSFDSSLRGVAEPESGGSKPTPKPYLYADELSQLTPWSVEAIRKMTVEGRLRLGVHYFQPGGRGTRILYKWNAIVEWIEVPDRTRLVEAERIPTSRGSVRRFDADKAAAELRRLLD